MVQKTSTKTEHVARASSQNIPISTKQSIEISRNLRYKNTGMAKKLLEEVIAMKRAFPYYRFVHDIGHRAGMSTGRYPQKASKEFLRLVKNVEANAHAKGLNTANLKITKIIANKASIPQTGNRWHRGTKRTHIEIEVVEMPALKKSESKEKKKETTQKTAAKKQKGESQ
ncbi:MAG: 50S ribosomal protein L22 [Candidatus Woesearchaeota archaeon]